MMLDRIIIAELLAEPRREFQILYLFIFPFSLSIPAVIRTTVEHRISKWTKTKKN